MSETNVVHPVASAPPIMSVVEQAAANMKALETTPELLDTVCEVLANGGSLITVADKYNVPYSRLRVWLDADDSRRGRISAALTTRDEWLIQRIIDELRDIGLNNPRELFKDDGSLRPLSEIPNAVLKCVSGIDIVETTDKDGSIIQIKRIRMIDKLKGIELLAKAMQGFVDRKQVAVDVTNTYKVQPYDIEDRLKIVGNDTGVVETAELVENNVRESESGQEPEDI